MRNGITLGLALIATLAAASTARAAVLQGYVQQDLASGLSRPVALAYAPDGRLFIGEQYTGRIKVLKNGAILSTPLATISPVYTGNNETGLLGLAVDPDFASNGYVYAFVTRSASEQVIVRLTAQGDRAVAQTTIVSGLPTRGVNHDGGGIAFGPDGLLYVSVGDNASRQDAQRTTSMRGKLLRFRKDGSAPAGGSLFALGLRNTFRFCFQPGTGAIWSTENGDFYDELNIIVQGGNYGWPVVEGIAGDSRFRDPIAEFAPTIAPTGCTFALGGDFFFGNHNQGKVHRVTVGAGGSVAVSDFVTGLRQPIDLVTAPDGSLVISTLGGRIVRVAPVATPSNQAPVASFTAAPPSGPAPLGVVFDGRASSDADGRIARYDWDFGDGTRASNAGAQVSHTYAAAGNYTASLTVTDDRGARATTTRAIGVTTHGTHAVSAHIEKPVDGSTVSSLTVSFAGHGHDDGDIVEHRWDFGDGSPARVIANPGSDVNSTPSHTYARPGTYTVTLRVKDDDGNTATDSIELTIPAMGAVGRTGTVIVQWLRVRSGPSAAYPILGYIPGGARVIVTAESGSYYRLTWPGAPANAPYWVWKTYVRLD